MQQSNRCIQLDSRLFIENNSFIKVCIDNKPANEEVLQTVKLIKPNGQVIELDPIKAVHPWFTFNLISDKFGEQWLAINYYADVDKPDGETFYMMLYQLSSLKKFFSSYSTEKVVFEDLDNDGFYEFVVHQPIALISYAIQPGWPIVYKLKESIETAKLQKYPLVSNRFIKEADRLLKHLLTTCEAISPTQQCEYHGDIQTLHKLIDLAKRLNQPPVGAAVVEVTPVANLMGDHHHRLGREHNQPVKLNVAAAGTMPPLVFVKSSARSQRRQRHPAVAHRHEH